MPGSGYFTCICVPPILQYGLYTHQCFYNDLLIWNWKTFPFHPAAN